VIEKPVLPPLVSNLTSRIGGYGWALRSPFGLELLRRGRETWGACRFRLLRLCEAIRAESATTVRQRFCRGVW
jgi:hypothetical protein